MGTSKIQKAWQKTYLATHIKPVVVKETFTKRLIFLVPENGDVTGPPKDVVCEHIERAGHASMPARELFRTTSITNFTAPNGMIAVNRDCTDEVYAQWRQEYLKRFTR